MDGNSNTLALTSDYFLTQGQLMCYPKTILKKRKDISVDMWSYLIKLYQQLWKLCSYEYINTLRQGANWRKVCPNIKENYIVFINEIKTSPNCWMLVRVIKVHIGTENIVRT